MTVSGGLRHLDRFDLRVLYIELDVWRNYLWLYWGKVYPFDVRQWILVAHLYNPVACASGNIQNTLWGACFREGGEMEPSAKDRTENFLG